MRALTRRASGIHSSIVRAVWTVWNRITRILETESHAFVCITNDILDHFIHHSVYLRSFICFIGQHGGTLNSIEIKFKSSLEPATKTAQPETLHVKTFLFFPGEGKDKNWSPCWMKKAIWKKSVGAWEKNWRRPCSDIGIKQHLSAIPNMKWLMVIQGNQLPQSHSPVKDSYTKILLWTSQHKIEWLWETPNFVDVLCPLQFLSRTHNSRHKDLWAADSFMIEINLCVLIYLQVQAAMPRYHLTQTSHHQHLQKRRNSLLRKPVPYHRLLETIKCLKELLEVPNNIYRISKFVPIAILSDLSLVDPAKR